MKTLELMLVALGLFFLVEGVIDSHNGPHHFKNSYCGHVFDEREITNPMYLTSEVKQRIGASGTMEFYSIQKTNYYWHPWSFGK